MAVPSGGGGNRTHNRPAYEAGMLPLHYPAPFPMSLSVSLPSKANSSTRDNIESETATMTGLEPATSSLTGKRALQLLHTAMLYCVPPTGIEPASLIRGENPAAPGQQSNSGIS